MIIVYFIVYSISIRNSSNARALVLISDYLIKNVLTALKNNVFFNKLIFIGYSEG